MNRTSRIRILMADANMGDAVSQAWLDNAEKELSIENHDYSLDKEMIFLLDRKGEFNGLIAPRWLCHLIGLRHGTVHIVLWSANNAPRMIFQLRSKTKKDFPGRLELSATGHGGTERDWITSAYREMHEEIGVKAKDLRNELVYVGEQSQSYDDDKQDFHDREHTRIYTQRLKPSGIASLHPKTAEVERLLFISENHIYRIYDEWNVAPGLKSSLPIYMDWFSQNRHILF